MKLLLLRPVSLSFRAVVEGRYCCILSLSFFMWSGTLDSSSFLLSYHIITRNHHTDVYPQTQTYILFIQHLLPPLPNRERRRPPSNRSPRPQRSLNSNSKGVNQVPQAQVTTY